MVFKEQEFFEVQSAAVRQAPAVSLWHFHRSPKKTRPGEIAYCAKAAAQ